MKRLLGFSLSVMIPLVGFVVLFNLLAGETCPVQAALEPEHGKSEEEIANIYTVCPDGPPACDFSVLQQAVDAAADGDTIQVAAGTYTQMNNYGGLAQVLYLDKSVILRGGYTTAFTEPPDPQANPTVLDAQGNGRVVFLASEYAAPVLEGFTMTHGDATGLGGTPYDDDAGGGLYLWGGAPVIRNCLITDNYSGFDGGGIYMRMFSQAQLINNVISNNTANFGAGIYIWYSYPLVQGNLIAGNTAGAAGGGVWLGVYSGGTFEKNIFEANIGTAAYNESAGGMLAERCTTTFDGNTFRENLVGGGGSGLTLIRCDSTLTNNLFVDNQVTQVGSSLYLTGANAYLYHNTFAGTRGGTPSGIYLDTHWEPRTSHATLVNTIIVSETTGIYAAGGNLAEMNATLWGDGTWANGGDWGGEGDILTGTLNLWDDPVFLNPSNGDYHIRSSSPAVDAGVDAGVTNDMDGQARPNGEGMDLGADEYWGGSLVVTTLEDELNLDGDCSLREAITAANTNLEVDACGAGSGEVLTDTITFSVAGTITLTSQLSVAAGGPLVIDGGEAITTSGGGTTRVWWVDTGSDLTLQRLNVKDGRSDMGGGILNHGNLTLINSTLASNFGWFEGGGLDNWGSAEIINSTIIDNLSWNEWLFLSGGGVANRGVMYINNSTFSGNEADCGGAVSNGGAITITNSTLSGNRSDLGAGICGLGIVINTIIANSPLGTDCVSPLVDGGHNISSDDTCGFDPANGSMPNTDPRLGALQDNGGPTWTHALLEGSPAIDSANDARCPSTDQRGVSRPQDGDGDGEATCDIGAYELLSPRPQIHIAPEALHAALIPNTTLTQTLTITNIGGLPLNFEIASPAESMNGTVLRMRMDEPAGSTTFEDSSGYENHAACSGESCPQAGLPGISGNAIEFDGDDYLLIPDSAVLNPQSAVSFSAWVYAYDWEGNRRILQKGDWDSQYRFFDETDEFHLDIYGIGRISTDLPSPGSWHHVVSLYDGARFQIWIDGQLKEEQAASGWIPVTGEPLYIGTKYPGAPPCDYFYGLMDEIRILDRALTPSEIAALYQVGEMPPWLSVEPVTGTLQAHHSLPIQVTFDSAGLLPDTYTTTLHFLSNDPTNPRVGIPVTLTVANAPVAVSISGPETGQTGELQSFTAAVEPLTTTLPLTYTWQATGQETVIHTGGTADTVAFTWLTPGLQVITVTVSNAVGSVVDTHAIVISAVLNVSPIPIYLPLMMIEQETGEPLPAGHLWKHKNLEPLVVKPSKVPNN